MIEWSGRPAYQQVADDLRRRIAAGEYAETGKLPSLAELERGYGVTSTVAREAIRALKAEGLAVSHQGKGAFLTADAAKRAGQADGLDELRREIEELRREVGSLRERVAKLEGH
ncbi:winged helix-turn-helix domain-containing protein [Streptomyces sp. RB6PN25]|uniref:Winged helix-turn-helix domain-containing protein n=1 Tax=Streptomyces humicola TaxID=2953240 RepID=A0ABT1PXS9_9ACTN|nr:winged helix-turn-helix domain-containing protein [Streptomyces humicola]MCQ4082476.1 winged helix-turn-helix domain-containing protein [Streptomyces humicola]